MLFLLLILLFGLLLLSDLVQGLEGTEFGESDLGDPSEDFLSSQLLLKPNVSTRCGICCLTTIFSVLIGKLLSFFTTIGLVEGVLGLLLGLILTLFSSSSSVMDSNLIVMKQREGVG